jgi:hypothetical protein
MRVLSLSSIVKRWVVQGKYAEERPIELGESPRKGRACRLPRKECGYELRPRQSQ